MAVHLTVNTRRGLQFTVNTDERKAKLEKYYHLVKRQIIQYQSPSTGLFRSHTSGRTNECHVRDSVYCAMAVWSLGLAYRRVDDDKGRSYEMEQSAVKCMRGILICYLKQADKVEIFKRTQTWRHALHCKFDFLTGNAYCGDDEWGHLQIDAVSLFLISLVQMTASGLQIIYTSDEVSFVQNLVYYIERAYRTPDYGMWERGTKENNGHRELHASSIGMAKAALESINGFNLYGSQGVSSSVIYVDPDAHNRNSTNLYTMLPRESSSKEVDAALLTITGFPAFAIEDKNLCRKTKSVVTQKLQGTFGLKRFYKDGFKTVLEDEDRKYYDKEELKQFEGIENEWPLFFIYLILDSLFEGDKNEAFKYEELLDPLLIRCDNGDVLVPHYYYVPKSLVEEERKFPETQDRVPGGNEHGDIFLWGQSLYILCYLLVEGLLDVNEIDALGRHLTDAQRNRFQYMSTRYSCFQVIESDLVIQVALIAENRRLQATLATYGIETQTPEEIEPIQIWPPSLLIKCYEYLGVNRKLGLSGRPTRPIGALGTSKVYRVLGRTVLTYPIILDEQDFYMSLDMSLLIDVIKTELAFIRNNWDMRGRPTFCIIIREKQFRGSNFKEVLEMMAEFKAGECQGQQKIKIRLGRLQTLISGACVEHLDFLHTENTLSQTDIGASFDEHAIKEREKPETGGFKSVGSSVLSDAGRDEHKEEDFIVTEHTPTHDLLHWYSETAFPKKQMIILEAILKREGANFHVHGEPLMNCITIVYHKAGFLKQWSIIRRGAGLLRKIVDSLAPAITGMLVRGKIVTIGVFGHEERLISEPLSPAAIENIVYTYCSPYDVREAVLQQEMILYLAGLLSTQPQIFDGMLKIRIGWVIQAMRNQLSLCGQKEDGESIGSIYSLSPSQVKQLLLVVLMSKGKVCGYDLSPRDWLQRRQLDGALHRVPHDFYANVWKVLTCTPGGLQVSTYHLQQAATLSEITEEEKNFALKVEEMLFGITHPEYRQIIVELLMVVSTILDRNPEVEFQQCIDLDHLVMEAKELFMQSTGQRDDVLFFNTQPTGKGGTMTYLARAVVNHLLQGSITVDPNHPCSVQ